KPRSPATGADPAAPDVDSAGATRTPGTECPKFPPGASRIRYHDDMNHDRHPVTRGGPRADEPDAVAAVRAALHGRADVRLAIVFGSRATGRATPASDVDVAVLAPGVDMLDLTAQLSRATGHEVDVVPLEDAGVPLLARILREGVLAHEARRGCAARWRSHTLAALETDAPWFARMRDAWLDRVAVHGF